MNNKLYIYNINNDHRTSYFKPPPVNLMDTLGWITIKFDLVNIENKIQFVDFLKNNNIKIIMCFFCDILLVNFICIIFLFDYFIFDIKK